MGNHDGNRQERLWWNERRTMSDTAQVPTSTPASVTPYRESRGRLIAEVAMANVVVGALILFGVTLASESDEIVSQSNDFSDASTSGKH